MSKSKIWKGNSTFILAAAGSAVGLGNIWKFPYMVGSNGGSAFVIVYLFCILIIGLPVMASEIIIGKYGRKSPINSLKKISVDFKLNQVVDIDAFKIRLNENGYLNVDKVLSPGEFAIRGSIIDIFPMGSIIPYRIDFFGNEIDSIRTFDVDTQRGLYPTKKIKLLPAREFPLDKDGISQFRDNYRSK